jgi:cytochrome b561
MKRRMAQRNSSVSTAIKMQEDKISQVAKESKHIAFYRTMIALDLTL